MSRPEHPLVVALVEQYARAIGVEPGRFWRLLDKKEAPTPLELRGLLHAWAPVLTAEDFAEPLTTVHEPNTVDGMPPALSSNALRSQAALSDATREHKFVRALQKRGETLAEAAETVSRLAGKKFSRSALAGWIKPKGDVAARGIPLIAAEAIRKEYGVPHTAWARVIPQS